MKVTITAWPDQDPSQPGSGHAHGFRTPFAGRIAVLFALAAIAVDDYLVGDEPEAAPQPGPSPEPLPAETPFTEALIGAFEVRSEAEDLLAAIKDAGIPARLSEELDGLPVFAVFARVQVPDRACGDAAEGDNDDEHGFLPGEVAAISGAIRSSGLYEWIDNEDAFLGHVLQAIQDHPDPESGAPTQDDVGAILRGALVAYFDAHGDGVTGRPEITDDEVADFYAAVAPMFAAPAPPAPAS